MSDEKVDAFLEHYGVLGMKWGVRKKRSTKTVEFTDRLTGAKGRVVVKNARGSKREKRKIERLKTRSQPSVKRLSDEQLRTAINRMQLERQYTQLRTDQTNNKAAKAFLAKHGTKIVGAALTGFATQQVGKGLNTAASKAAAKAAAKRAARK